MKKQFLIMALNNEIERLRATNKKQRISEAKNLQGFTDLLESSTLENINIQADTDMLNIGVIAISLCKALLNGKSNFAFDYHKEQLAVDQNGNKYQLASIVKSRSAKPKDNGTIKGFIYLVYTSTVKGIYKIDKDIILNQGSDKIPASFVRDNGTLLRAI